MTYNLPWGREQKIAAAVPTGWKVVVEHRAVEKPALKNFPEAAARALAAPSDGPPLAELVRGAKSAVMVIDDVGRPTPAHLMAPAALDSLLASGLREDRVTLVFATGTHRPMTKDEMKGKAGDAADKVNCINHDFRDTSGLKHFGTTSLGTPVFINRVVADADLRVLIGTIEPHPQAGFGGGLKNILPGCAGAASIGHNHLIMPSPQRWNMIGTLPEENPMRRDIEEAAMMIPGKSFILNTVLGPDLAPVALISGDPIKAHRRGVAIAREIYGVRLPRRLDAAIVSSFPMDFDLRQGVKGITNAPGAVRKSGVIICFLKCDRGMEDMKLPAWVPPLSPIRTLLRLFGSRRIYGLTKRLPKSVPIEARFIINFALQLIKDYHVLIFSPRIAEDTKGKLPDFIFDDQEKMFKRAEEILGTDSPEACIIAEGGVSFPIIDK